MVTGFAIGSLGAFAGVATADTESESNWQDYYGEILTIEDFHDDDRPAIAKLWVGGSGPAVFYGNGDDTTRKENLSYAEGQTVHLQAFTSDSPNAVCTAKARDPGRT